MIIRKHFSLKYNTLYYPFKADGSADITRTYNRFHNFGNEKRVDIGGGIVYEDDQLAYGIYCKARGLFGFDSNDFTDASITGKNLQANLRLYNLSYAPSVYTIPSVTLEIYPLTASGDAGTFTSASALTGYSNGENRTSTQAWGTEGGMDVDFAMSASVNLEYGNKNIEVDVSSQLIHSLTSGTRYYGFLVKLPDSIESSTAVQYWVKSIYTGDFTLPYHQARMDVAYDDYDADDRGSMVAGSSGNIYFSNFINGSPTNINYDTVTVELMDENDRVVASANSINSNETGYYYATLTVPISAYKSHYSYKDKGTFTYSDGSTLSEEKNVVVKSPVNSEYDSKRFESLNIHLNKYETNQRILCTVSWQEKYFPFFRRSFGSNHPETYVPKEIYYRIYAVTESMSKEIGYQSDGDRMSYNSTLNYLTIDKNQFPMGKYYIELKVVLFGKTLYFKNKAGSFNIMEDFVSNSLYG